MVFSEKITLVWINGKPLSLGMWIVETFLPKGPKVHWKGRGSLSLYNSVQINLKPILCTLTFGSNIFSFGSDNSDKYYYSAHH